jgi:hypothetical protein
MFSWYIAHVFSERLSIIIIIVVVAVVVVIIALLDTA